MRFLIFCTLLLATAGALIQCSNASSSTAGYSIKSISPQSGTAAGGTAVTITGAGFVTTAKMLGTTATTSVKIGGTAATSVTVVSDTSITAVTPPHTGGGAADVVVANTNANSATLTSGFVYVASGNAKWMTANKLFVADTSAANIRIVDFGTGIISAYTGTGSSGFSLNNTALLSAQVSEPVAALALDDATIVFTNSGSNCVQTTAGGVITTVAGICNGTSGSTSGNGGLATAAELNGPTGLCKDASGKSFYRRGFLYSPGGRDDPHDFHFRGQRLRRLRPHERWRTSDPRAHESSRLRV